MQRCSVQQFICKLPSHFVIDFAQNTDAWHFAMCRHAWTEALCFDSPTHTCSTGTLPGEWSCLRPKHSAWTGMHGDHATCAVSCRADMTWHKTGDDNMHGMYMHRCLCCSGLCDWWSAPYADQVVLNGDALHHMQLRGLEDIKKRSLLHM